MARKKADMADISSEETVAENTGLRSSALKAAEAAIKKQFGEGALVFLKDYIKKTIDIVPTGSLTLDHALGVGGFPRGKMVELFGPPSGGKTTLAMSVAANFINQDPSKNKVLYIDAEKAFSGELAFSMGIPMDNLMLVDALSAEENLMAAETLIKTGEFGICIVDSVAALTPRAEYEATLDDQQMGLHGRLMSKMCRNIKSVLRSTNTMFLLINQLRQKIGSYGDGETTTGGNAIPFYADVRVRVSGGASKKTLIIDPSTGDAVGQRTSFYVKKNKLAPPFRTAEVDLIYGRGFDYVSELSDLGEQVGLVDRTGAWLMYGDEKFHGVEKMKIALSENKDLAEKLKSEVLAILYAKRSK